jgi:putative DNA primase/helicase
VVDTSPLTSQELALVEAGRPSPASGGRDAEGQPIVPVPEEVEEPCFDVLGLGAPSKIWCYRDAEGRVLFYQRRFETSGGGKEYRPLTYCQDRTGRRAWRSLGGPKPYPLYGLDELAARPDAPVLVVEGEKAADAARTLFPEMVAITSPFGAKSASKSDWSPLAGRDVVIWPDNDDAGFAYAAAVANLARAAGAASVKIVEVS